VAPKGPTRFGLKPKSVMRAAISHSTAGQFGRHVRRRQLKETRSDILIAAPATEWLAIRGDQQFCVNGAPP
jgi:hypothetical protein